MDRSGTQVVGLEFKTMDGRGGDGDVEIVESTAVEVQ